MNADEEEILISASSRNSGT